MPVSHVETNLMEFIAAEQFWGSRIYPLKFLNKKQTKNLGLDTFILEKMFFFLTLCYGEQQQNF